MASRHFVKITTTFQHTHSIGALMVAGAEVDAPQTRTVTYTEGEEHWFYTKKEAMDFSKFHGFDKTSYVGKKSV